MRTYPVGVYLHAHHRARVRLARAQAGLTLALWQRLVRPDRLIQLEAALPWPWLSPPGPPLAGWGSRAGPNSPGADRPTPGEGGSRLGGAAASVGTVEGEGTPGSWDEEGGDETDDADGGMGEGSRGGVAGGGGGVGQAIGGQLWETVTGDGAGNVGGPLAEGDGGFWTRGGGAAMGTSGRGPATFPGGLLIMMGGEGGKGVKLHAGHTADLGGGSGVTGPDGEGGWG